MKILVTGANGFVGHKLMEMCEGAVASPSLRGMSEDGIREMIENSGAEVIIHTAAISSMNVCEKDPDASYQANVIIPTYLAKACKGRKLICFSSDQVYNGNAGDGPFAEADASPSNVYAKHKFEMEQRVLDILPESVMLRAEWMYDYTPGKFNYLMMVLNAEGPLSCGPGEYRGVTYLREVAENMKNVIKLPGGSYNFGSETDKSVYDFTADFLKYLGKDVKLLKGENGKSLRMDCSKARRFGVNFSSVSGGLKRCAEDYGLTGAKAVSRDRLTTKGSKIVDGDGREVWLKGVNWFGYNTGDNALGGLEQCSLKDMISQISERGFNFMRIPVSCEILLQWMNGEYPNARFSPSLNPELKGLNSLEIFDLTLDTLKEHGIRVMIDIHSAETGLMGHIRPLWYTEKIDESMYLKALSWTAARYAASGKIAAYDIKNEPHGRCDEPEMAVWNGSSARNNWRHFAALAGNAVLDSDHHALIVIEGIQMYPKHNVSNDFTSKDPSVYRNTWWGGNLMGVRDFPVDLGSEARNRQIVYSVHEYGPTVYMQPWFEDDYSYKSLVENVWRDLWLYIVEEDAAPVLIGEWGGFTDDVTLKWLKCMRRLISDYRLNFAFWCLNPASPDTGGLLKDDFSTWDETKYDIVRPLLDGNGGGVT